MSWSQLDPFNKNSAVRAAARHLDQHVLQPAGHTLATIIGTSTVPILTPYLTLLHTQALTSNNAYQPLPDWLKAALIRQQLYDVDLNQVRYTQNINTVHGCAITIGYNIFFPTAIDLTRTEAGLTCRADVHWMLHELEHVVQYRKYGGVWAFLAKYLTQGIIAIVDHKSVVNIAEHMELEQQAVDKANKCIDEVA